MYLTWIFSIVVSVYALSIGISGKKHKTLSACIASSLQLSCHNATDISNTCCSNYPGGLLLQTQFWDTDPATGPSDSWTVHGLWPDYCNGSFGQFCDSTRQYTNITAILQSFYKAELLDFMQTYWKSDSGTDESFWEHEWNKHGTCISTLEPRCYENYVPQQEVAEYFQQVVDLFKTLSTYTILQTANISPSLTKTYTLDQIQTAIRQATGHNATVQCGKNNTLDEVWYYFNVRGRAQAGKYVHTNPNGLTTSCPETGIQYLPKYQRGVPVPDIPAPSAAILSTTFSLMMMVFSIAVASTVLSVCEDK